MGNDRFSFKKKQIVAHAKNIKQWGYYEQVFKDEMIPEIRVIILFQVKVLFPKLDTI